MKDWKTVKKELLQNPVFKREYEDSEPEYQIARAVIRARIEKKITQKELAVKMKTTQSVISRVENAGTVPSVSFLKRLATVLGLSLKIQLG
jgi:ribosome-binding protein aMBF1 (putative translation factor)